MDQTKSEMYLFMWTRGSILIWRSFQLTLADLSLTLNFRWIMLLTLHRRTCTFARTTNSPGMSDLIFVPRYPGKEINQWMTEEGNQALVLVEINCILHGYFTRKTRSFCIFPPLPPCHVKTTRTACVSSATSLTSFVNTVNAQWLVGTIFLAALCATGSAKNTTSVASPPTSARSQENEVASSRFLFRGIYWCTSSVFSSLVHTKTMHVF